MQVGVVGEGDEWQLIHQLPNEPDARSMEVPDLNPFTYYRYGARRRGAAHTAVGSALGACPHPCAHPLSPTPVENHHSCWSGWTPGGAI